MPIINLVYEAPEQGGWQPGANTYLYLPMDTDLLDHSGNSVSVTNYGIQIDNTVLPNIGVASFRGYSSDGLQFTSMAFGTNDFTISWWEKPTTSSSGHGSRFYSAWVGGNVSGMLFGYSWQYMYVGNGSSWFIDTVVFNSAVNNWNYWVVTRNGNSRKAYRNGVQVWATTNSGSVGYDTAVIGNYRPGDANTYIGYMSKFIIENKARTDTEISDYYDQTKGDYGIS